MWKRANLRIYDNPNKFYYYRDSKYGSFLDWAIFTIKVLNRIIKDLWKFIEEQKLESMKLKDYNKDVFCQT